jgi:FkbM family methyltransferase
MGEKAMSTMSLFIEVTKKKLNGKIPNVILDVGSRDLDQSIELKQHFPTSRIIAFEPNPPQFEICKQRAAQFNNIEVHNLALSDEDGVLDFWVVDGNPGGSSLLEPIYVPFSHNRWSKISVNCKRLDNVLKELAINQVDVMWMDAQGVELKVLKGMGEYINTVQTLHTEACPNAYYKGHILQNEVENFLKDNNFAFQFIPANPHPFGEGDLICVKNN